MDKSSHKSISYRFFHRLMRSLLICFIIILIALFVGMCGYHYLENMRWIDAFVNAAMILSGMGPLNPLNTFAGKLFAGLYALFSGLAIIIMIGVIIAPVIHHFIRKFKLEDEQNR